ncbi:hypothetical protein [Seinonella peptonophila]|nr:hypothetical protein [Seinonella peptonophila]
MTLFVLLTAQYIVRIKLEDHLHPLSGLWWFVVVVLVVGKDDQDD